MQENATTEVYPYGDAALSCGENCEMVQAAIGWAPMTWER
jgi:hypothetical protein